MINHTPDGGYLLPAEIDPEREPVIIYIPCDENHRRAFWGALDSLTWWANWQRDEAKTARFVRDVWAEIVQCAQDDYEAAKMDGMFRQNPDDTCQFQMRSCGEWVTVFDYGLCTPLRPADIAVTADIMAQLQILLESYDGEVGSVAPDLVYDSTPEDENRDHVMCAAVTLAVRALVDALIRQARTESTLIELIGAGIGIIAGVWLAAFTGGVGAVASAPLAVGIAGAIIGLAGLASQLSLDILEDSEFIEDFICCIVGGLAGQTPTQIRMTDAAGECENVFTNPLEQEFIFFVIAAIERNDFYVSFLDFAQRLYDAPQVADFVCECDPTWEHVFDFENDNDDGDWQIWSHLSRPWPVLPSYVPSTGWIHGDQGTAGGDANRRRGIALSRQFDTRVITHVELRYDLVKGSINSGGTSSQGLVDYTDDDTFDVLISRSFNATPAGTNQVFEWNGNRSMNGIALHTWSSRQSNNSWSGSVTFRKITIRGIGTNPFTL